MEGVDFTEITDDRPAFSGDLLRANPTNSPHEIHSKFIQGGPSQIGIQGKVRGEIFGNCDFGACLIIDYRVLYQL